jgi:CRP-like cAMP-binding protein
MTARPVTPKRPPNRLLAALPAEDYARILPTLRTVPLEFKQVLLRPGDQIKAVYFPSKGVCSIVSVMGDGRLIEVAVVGSEGMIGITAFFGGEFSVAESIVQVPGGVGQTMPIEVFRREIARRGALHDIVGRYAQALMAMFVQSVACNGLHNVEERCARWLLMTNDRAGNEFQLTQEFLAVMLGVRRSTVTEVMGTLQEAAIVGHAHGTTRILNRKALEARACECYGVVKSHYDRLLPSS